MKENALNIPRLTTIDESVPQGTRLIEVDGQLALTNAQTKAELNAHKAILRMMIHSDSDTQEATGKDVVAEIMAEANQMARRLHGKNRRSISKVARVQY